jgi:hypothetical protein
MSRKRKAKDNDLPSQPPKKKFKANVIDKRGERVDIWIDLGISIEKKSGISRDLFICIYDEEWPHHKKDVEMLKNRFGNECDFREIEAKKIVAYSDHLKPQEGKKSIISDLFDYYQKQTENDVVKLIVYFTGHCCEIENENYPSFQGKDKVMINTKDLYQEIVNLKKFDLVIFIADMCSVGGKDIGSKVKIHGEIDSAVRIFDFQGNCYIRTSQSKTCSYGDAERGSYFCNFLSKQWDGSWIELIGAASRALWNVQICSGIGTLKSSRNREIKYESVI